MEITTLRIRNMVCNRCIRVVREELERLGLQTQEVGLGYAVIAHASELNLEAVGRHLAENEFELIGDGKAELVEQIKIEIIELVRSGLVKDIPTNLSNYLASKLDKDYHTLTLWFSEIEQMTLTKYLALQKIERVKELLEYGELKMGEIARQLGYSSIGHLSNQFKQVTGFSPSYYKKHIQYGRTSLDRLRTSQDH